MVIRLNGDLKDVPSGTTVEQLVGIFRLNKKTVVCELNKQVVDRKSFTDTVLKENDIVEILHFVGGG